MKHRFIQRLQDALVIFQGIWFLVLFDILAIIAFLFVPQGGDMLLIITENALSGKGYQLVGLITATLFWCISSEYCTRMLTYLADNSGRSLDPDRVNDRKRYEKWLATTALFFPIVLLVIAFIKVYLANFSALSAATHVYDLSQITEGTILIILLLLIAGALLWWLYPGKLIKRLSEKYKGLSWLTISQAERNWASKLFGMLNDVRVDIPASDTTYTGRDLPRGTELPDGMTIPDSPYFVPDEQNPKMLNGGIKVWMFHIDIRFYRCLLRQLYVLLAIALVLIVSIGLLIPVKWAMNLGAVAIIIFAFGSWPVIYLSLHLLDKVIAWPVRLTLFFWLLFCSYFNNDHPVRTIGDTMRPRAPLNRHFQSWVTDHVEKDTMGNTYYRVGPDHDSIPVIFISAEGGALRTGAFTGMLLARLQDEFPMFEHYLYGYSSVSGGTVGSNFFNAQVIRARLHGGYEKHKWIKASKNFFETDFLSAVTAKLAFGEILNYFYPRRWDCADRAIALEKSFEEGWRNSYGDEPNMLAAPFDITTAQGLPAVFINTTQVESGLQNVWSNVNLGSIPLSNCRDLHTINDLKQDHSKAYQTLPYSSAIDLSDRFPLVSPAACFFWHNKSKTGSDSISRGHFIDGGYYENKGSETLLQVLKSISWKGQKIKPYILQFNFSGDTTAKEVRFANEISEITGGLYDTRGGRGQIAEDALKKYVDTLHGTFISLYLKMDVRQLPMNWVLSKTVITNLDTDLKKMVGRAHEKDNQVPELFKAADKVALHRLFFYDNTNIKHGGGTK